MKVKRVRKLIPVLGLLLGGASSAPMVEEGVQLRAGGVSGFGRRGAEGREGW